MRGGMTMVGDMFNQGLQSTVAGLCSELASLLASQQVFVPLPQTSQSQSSAGFASSGNFGHWWPSDLGSPSSSGGQNDSRYAYFPAAHRLAVEVGGVVTIYDTLDHQIGGVQQQQGGLHGSQSFTSQFGTFTVNSLPIVSGGRTQNQTAPYPAQPPANVTASARFTDGQDDVFAKLERLGALRDKGVISDQEFQAKKAELLARV